MTPTPDPKKDQAPPAPELYRLRLETIDPVTKEVTGTLVDAETPGAIVSYICGGRFPLPSGVDDAVMANECAGLRATEMVAAGNAIAQVLLENAPAALYGLMELVKAAVTAARGREQVMGLLKNVFAGNDAMEGVKTAFEANRKDGDAVRAHVEMVSKRHFN